MNEDGFQIYIKPGLRWALVWGIVLFCGCIVAIPKELAQKVDKSISFKELEESPTSYKGKLVALGGTILKAKNTKEGTELEVLEKPLAYYNIPEDTDKSGGRFLVLYKGYLDTAIYKPGRTVTIAGEVLGAETRPLDEIKYTYPYLEVKSIYLWEDTRYSESPNYTYSPGSYPYWWPHPYYYPIILQDSSKH